MGSALPELMLQRVVKRNTLFLAASKAFVGVGNQMVPTLGAIIVARLVGSTHLADMATSALGVSRFLVSYPTGRIADLYGRRVAIVVGLVLGLADVVGTGLSVLSGAFTIFLLSILVFGCRVGAGYQLRVAATDMYPPNQRAQALGFVLTGSLVGALGAPLLITSAQNWSGSLGLDPLALAWFIVPAAILPGIGFPVIGTFGFSLPLGWVADLASRSAVMLVGFLFLAGGAVLVPATLRYWIVVTGTFMVEVGWSAVTLAATAIIADVMPSFECGRAIGANDSFSAVAAIALPLLAGPAVKLFGLSALAILGTSLVIFLFVLLLRRLKDMTSWQCASRASRDDAGYATGLIQV